ncbi:UNVERIFIED_CONTAM: thiol reductant ABC exporter subunit CydD [Halobacillus marinus]|uniref:thiol reductant ABC exporter subunit CydD n=1 Tax=Halobacillus sp. BAB-2008 TaxID=1246484 RepID=UPI0002A4D0A4|nr:thiol reductant ABC exporter subunit CydD [Halobacillus sp. BAB-2008]ELK46940.1 ABC-type transport system ATP-binding/permease protein [Halobacillus sp. BAB-2008]
MKQLSRVAFRNKGVLWALIVTSFLIGATIIGQSYFFVAIVDRIFLGNESFGEIVPLLAGLLLVLAGRTFFTWWNGRIGVKMAADSKRYFRRQVLSKFTRNPLQSAMEGQSGRKVSVLLDSVDEIDGYYSSYLPQMIQTMIIPFMILIVVFAEHLYSGLIMIITAPFIPLFMAIIGVMTKKKSEEQMEKLSAFSGKFLDTLQGLTTLKLFGRSKQQVKEIETSSHGFRDATMEVLKVAFVSSLMLEFISMLSIGLIALEIAIRLVVYEQISFFSSFFILILAPEFYLTLKDFGSAFHTGRGSAGAANQLAAELEKEEEDLNWGEERLVTDAPPPIEFKEVSFQYGEGFSLQDLNLKLPSGTQLAIVGKSGAGKTTALHMFAGLVKPQKGEIIVNGKSLFSYHEEDWFRRVSYISQNPYLFSGTMAENIAIGDNGRHSMEEIREAARKAGISDLIESLDQGYDTPVGEGGRGLSGGEKQRLAIARAFLKKPSIILFDEPTTGLDLKTERVLQHSIAALAEYSTIITVAHRLHTIKNADQILFLDKGEQVGLGTHEALLQEVPEYRRMVTVQKGDST